LPTPDQPTLDPQNWDDLRQLGHRMVDEMMTWLETVRERPVWQRMPDTVRASFTGSAPRQPEGAEQAYADFTANVLPYPTGNIHPRFWGWVMGNGTPSAALAEMLAATMNPNVGGADHAANLVEAQVIEWCKEITGYAADASGILVSGGSMANLVGLAVARNASAGFDVRRLGVMGGRRPPVQAARGPMVLYASIETHSSVQKAVELMGLGEANYRRIPVNDQYEVDVAALAAAIAEDRAAGCQPLCVVGNAGTVNTGAIDDLTALAELCRREKLWFHVDGAFGAIAALDPEYRARLAGMEQADSLAFDLHKWMYMPYEVGCVLVRHPETHRDTFSLTPGYLVHATRGTAAGDLWFSELGPQLSRGFRALKVWMSIKEHGLDRFAALVRQNVDQARYLGSLVEQHEELELLAPVPLNIVCYRYVAPGLSEEQLNALNAELLIRLQESGVAVPSNAVLNGHYALRVANTNYRSRREDFDLLVRETVRVGRELRVES
jgi:glutamate/tyrosine decarboxylase-like PLP-dependent enzyme